MNKLFVIAAALILALIQGSNGRILNSNEQQMVLNKHNEMRSKAANGELTNFGFQTAAKLYPLTWDNSLANSAERLAESCVYDHDRVGQNIAQGGGSFAPQVSIPGVPNKQPAGNGICTNCYSSDQEAVEFLEYSWITYHGTEIQRGPNVQNHFTQMVDDDSFKIGCAINNKCTNFGQMGPYYLVCNYDPAGNTLNTPVYATGATASQCPNGSNNGLCSGTPQSGSGSSTNPSTGGQTGGQTGGHTHNDGSSTGNIPYPINQVCGNQGGTTQTYQQPNNYCVYLYYCNNGYQSQYQQQCV